MVAAVAAKRAAKLGLNPCYSGCCSDGVLPLKHWLKTTSLNPCYSGCCSDGAWFSLCMPGSGKS